MLLWANVCKPTSQESCSQLVKKSGFSVVAFRSHSILVPACLSPNYKLALCCTHLVLAAHYLVWATQQMSSKYLCNSNFSYDDFLMMVFKCFNLPFSSLFTRGSRKKEYRGSGLTCLEMLLQNNSHLCCLATVQFTEVTSDTLIHSHTLAEIQQSSSVVWVWQLR